MGLATCPFESLTLRELSALAGARRAAGAAHSRRTLNLHPLHPLKPLPTGGRAAGGLLLHGWRRRRGSRDGCRRRCASVPAIARRRRCVMGRGCRSLVAPCRAGRVGGWVGGRHDWDLLALSRGSLSLLHHDRQLLLSTPRPRPSLCMPLPPPSLPSTTLPSEPLPWHEHSAARAGRPGTRHSAAARRAPEQCAGAQRRWRRRGCWRRRRRHRCRRWLLRVGRARRGP